MNVFQLAEDFSKTLKIAKINYLFEEDVQINQFDYFLKVFAQVDLDVLNTDSKKKAFYINIYNGFTNYLIIKQRLKSHMKEMSGFFNIPIITLQKHTFSLNDIEHGLLRKNARNHLFLNDERLLFQVEKLDYRIHFALNCGAVSCPPIASYSLAHLDDELNIATSNFEKNEFKVNSQSKTITCSEIFIWYRKDFEKKYLNDPRYKGYTIVKKPYDWSL